MACFTSRVTRTSACCNSVSFFISSHSVFCQYNSVVRLMPSARDALEAEPSCCIIAIARSWSSREYLMESIFCFFAIFDGLIVLVLKSYILGVKNATIKV